MPALEMNPTRVIMLGMFVLALLSFPGIPRGGAGQARKWLYLAGFVYLCRFLLSMKTYSVEAVLRESYTSLGFLSTLAALSAPLGYEWNWARWLRPVAIAGMIAGALAAGVWYRVIPIPPWSEREEIFMIERTGWCVDGMIGVLGQMACLALVVAPRRRFDRILGFVGYFPCWVDVLLGQFRTYVGLGLFLTAGVLCWAFLDNWRRLAGGLTVMGVFLILVVADPMDRVSAVTDRFFFAADLGSDVVRMSELQLELELIRLDPLFGRGFGLQYYEGHSPLGDAVMPAYGHNLFTSLSARAGIPLAAMLLLGWAWLGVRCLRCALFCARGQERVIHLCGGLIVFGVLICGPVLNLFTMSWSAPVYAFFIAPSFQRLEGAQKRRVGLTGRPWPTRRS